MSDMIERPTDAADPTYPDAERCAQTLENCEDDLLTEAQFVRWQGQEIERLTAALRHEADCVEAAKAEIDRLTEENRRLRADLLAGRNVVNAGLTIHTLTLERDELRRQLAEAEQDARRYRWLRNEANTARKCDPMVCIYPLDEQDLIDGDRLDIAIDAVMGGGDA